MDFLTWNESLSVGIKHFDDEHKNLVAFVNKLNQALIIGSAQRTIGEILTSLIRYTEIHFKHEEEYMLLYDYPDFQEHKAEHDKLTAQVKDFHGRFKAGNAPFSLELMTFLRDWLTEHIMKTDMKYKMFFVNKGIR